MFEVFYQVGKIPDVALEMSRMRIDVLGIAETFWDEVGEFQTSMPNTDEEYKVIYSGGVVRRNGVALL